MHASATTRDNEITCNPHSARRVGAGRAHLFVAPSRRCPCIASSSRLDLGSDALPTNVTVFIEREYLGGEKDRFLDFILGVRNHGRSCCIAPNIGHRSGHIQDPVHAPDQRGVLKGQMDGL